MAMAFAVGAALVDVQHCRLGIEAEERHAKHDRDRPHGDSLPEHGGGSPCVVKPGIPNQRQSEEAQKRDDVVDVLLGQQDVRIGNREPILEVNMNTYCSMTSSRLFAELS